MDHVGAWAGIEMFKTQLEGGSFEGEGGLDGGGCLMRSATPLSL